MRIFYWWLDITLSYDVVLSADSPEIKVIKIVLYKTFVSRHQQNSASCDEIVVIIDLFPALCTAT